MALLASSHRGARGRGLSALPLALVLSIATLTACTDRRPDDVLGTSAEALTSTVTFRRGTYGTVADTYVSSSTMNKNYGAQKKMVVSAQNEALLRFDLGSIPPNAVVQAANLTLTINGGEEEGNDDCPDGDHEGNAIAPIKVRRVTAAWSEGTVTYSSFGQAFAPAVEGTIILGNRRSTKTVDVRSLVAGWVAGTYPNHGLVLTTAGNQHTIIVSSEHPPRAERPSLTVRFVVPENHCAANPCAHGVCTNQLDGFTCACDPGYDGTTCDHNVDDCSPNPCEHGTCADHLGGFACTCAPGFTGATCATDIDECAPNPCQNGGGCTNQVAGHACTCPAGYSGVNCETVDVCSELSNPCQNGGTCSLLPGNTYACTCPPGYEGANCQVDSNDCPENACSNHGVCADGTGAYTCQCDGGYTGTECEQVIEQCGPDACANSGTCEDNPTGFTCTCQPGYEGPTCLVDHDDCDPNPCAIDEQCIDHVASHQCVVPPATTALVLAPIADTHVGGNVTVSATLTRVTSPAGPLGGSDVTFEVLRPDDTTSYTDALTNATGVAQGTFSVNQAGLYTVTAIYEGAEGLAPATTTTTTFTVTPIVTLIASDAHGVAGDPTTVTVSGTELPSGTPLDGVMVDFDFFGVVPSTSALASGGIASTTVTFPLAGTYPYEATVGGAPGGASGSITVAAVVSQLDEISTGSVPLGSEVTFRVLLSRVTPPSGPLAGRPVQFEITSPSNTPFVTDGTSGPDGVVFSSPFVLMELGSWTVRASYAGDGATVGSSVLFIVDVYQSQG